MSNSCPVNLPPTRRAIKPNWSSLPPPARSHSRSSIETHQHSLLPPPRSKTNTNAAARREVPRPASRGHGGLPGGGRLRGGEALALVRRGVHEEETREESLRLRLRRRRHPTVAVAACRHRRLVGERRALHGVVFRGGGGFRRLGAGFALRGAAFRGVVRFPVEGAEGDGIAVATAARARGVPALSMFRRQRRAQSRSLRLGGGGGVAAVARCRKGGRWRRGGHLGDTLLGFLVAAINVGLHASRGDRRTRSHICRRTSSVAFTPRAISVDPRASMLLLLPWQWRRWQWRRRYYIQHLPSGCARVGTPSKSRAGVGDLFLPVGLGYGFALVEPTSQRSHLRGEWVGWAGMSAARAKRLSPVR